MDEELEGMAEGGADPRDEDLCTDDGGVYYCGRSAGGGRLAPCTLCEWVGLCPQHDDQPGRIAGGRDEAT